MVRCTHRCSGFRLTAATARNSADPGSNGAFLFLVLTFGENNWNGQLVHLERLNGWRTWRVRKLRIVVNMAALLTVVLDGCPESWDGMDRAHDGQWTAAVTLMSISQSSVQWVDVCHVGTVVFFLERALCGVMAGVFA